MRLFFWLATLAWAATGSAALANPVVAIIDSGIARTAELAPRLVAEVDLASEAPRAAFEPRYAHGTMVATILVRAAAGQVDIVSLRIDDPAGCPPAATPPCQPSITPIVNAIDKAVEMKVDAINISLSMPDSPSLKAAVKRAADQGIQVVLAAGNRGLDHPENVGIARAGYPRTVLVGAVDNAGRPWSGTSRPDGGAGRDYSYVWRSGVRVVTQDEHGRTVMGTGTSFAAPTETARLVTHRQVLAD